MSSNYYPNRHKLLSEWTQIHIELIKQNCIRLTTGIRWRNLHVFSTCEQQRPLSPCHSATFVKETAREALVFKLQLNCDTLAYMYYIENLGDPFVYIFKFSMWGYECIFWKLLNAIFPFVDFFLLIFPELMQC